LTPTFLKFWPKVFRTNFGVFAVGFFVAIFHQSVFSSSSSRKSRSDSCEKGVKSDLTAKISQHPGVNVMIATFGDFGGEKNWRFLIRKAIL
jgi:hypothetical protein